MDIDIIDLGIIISIMCGVCDNCTHISVQRIEIIMQPPYFQSNGNRWFDYWNWPRRYMTIDNVHISRLSIQNLQVLLHTILTTMCWHTSNRYLEFKCQEWFALRDWRFSIWKWQDKLNRLSGIDDRDFLLHLHEILKVGIHQLSFSSFWIFYIHSCSILWCILTIGVPVEYEIS